ncbi:MAG: class I tRNA ligase family protein [Bacteroidetes bacterium]|nr:class I tRNA ligase family protein [Bacteroidota bacterium]
MLGYKIIRFTNEEVIGNMDSVINSIWKELAGRPLQRTKPESFFGGWLFPADFIAEGVDQTRGWFFTLHVLAVALFDSVAYKNVVSNGLLLDKTGNKMSKRLGNIIEPFELLEKYSADATRWYMMRNSDPWDNMKFDVAGLQDVTRSHFGTLYNTYSFFALYANIDNWKIDEKNIVPISKRPELDRWVISKLHSLIKDVTAFYEDYEPTKAARAIEKFVDEDLSNWYVRLNRRRFWKGQMSEDKKAAYETLHECLNVVGQLMSPVAPFFSDWLYRNLNGENASVHVSHLFKANKEVLDTDLEERMELAQRTCSLVLSLRKKEKIKVRQPLQRIMVPVLNERMKAQLSKVEEYILSEVNVKAIEYISDASGVVKKKIKPNFRELGKKVGAKMKALQTAIAAFTQEDLQKLEQDKVYALNLDGENFNLEISDVEILSEDIPGWLVASEGALTVALDVTLTDDLRNEGNAREFVNKVQNIRKDKGFQVLDRIKVSVVKNRTFESTLTQFKDYISSEILAKEIELVDSLNDFEEVELNEEILKVKVELN